MLNALEGTTLAYVVVTDKSNQFYEPRKFDCCVTDPEKRKANQSIVVLLSF